MPHVIIHGMSFLTKDIDAPFNALKAYRPDIDGLKAISILAVMIFHYTSSFVTGGFVGVDVFFVISGYLIGRSTFIELKLKTFRFGAYFGRRAKRIFPSLIVLLLVLWILGFFILLPDEYKSLGKHIGAASVFISNWLLWREIGYFDTAADEKPLLNLWSLGVEEQFYLVFPLIILLTLRLRGRVFWVMSALAVGSLIASQLRVADNAGWAYYHPVSRIWELLAGSMLAYAELSFANHPSRIGRPMLAQHKNLLSWVGIIFLAASIFWYSKATVFPGVTALLPVTGALLLIAAGPDAFINRTLLSKRPLIYIGLISYPLYLWHWPLIATVRLIDGMPPPLWVKSICLLLTFTFSAASYHFIERPIRFGRASKKKILPVWLWGALLTIGAAGFITFKLAGPSPTHTDATPIQSVPQNATKQVALIGNSHAGILKDSLTTYFAQQGYALEIFDQGGCTPFWNLDRHDVGHGPQGCPKDINRGIQAALDRPTMDTIVFAARFEDPGSLYDVNRPETDRVKNGLSPSDDHNWALFESALDNTLKQLTDAKKRVLIIENVPTLSFPPKDCVDRPVRIASTIRQPCAMPKSEVLNDQKQYRDIIDRITAKYPTVVVFDPLPALCDNQFCYGKLNGDVLYSDKNHLTDAGVQRLAPGFNF